LNSAHVSDYKNQIILKNSRYFRFKRIVFRIHAIQPYLCFFSRAIILQDGSLYSFLSWLSFHESVIMRTIRSEIVAILAIKDIQK